VKTAKQFWHENLGRHLVPGSDFDHALMTGYPHADRAGRTCRLGGSEPARFLVEDGRASVWSPIKPVEGAPESVSFYKTSDRKRREWVIDILLNPPATPFLAASVGMSGVDADSWALTVDPDLIVFGGSKSLLPGGTALNRIQRSRFLEGRSWFEENPDIKARDFLQFMQVHREFKTGVLGSDAARRKLARSKVTKDIFDAYPGEKMPYLISLCEASVLYYEPQKELQNA